MRELIDLTKKTGKEYGFFICQDKRGRFYTTKVISGREDQLTVTKVPKNAIAFFHTHTEIEKDQDIQMSDEDVNFTLSRGLSAMLVGLPDYTVEVYYFIPDEDVRKQWFIWHIIAEKQLQELLQLLAKKEAGIKLTKRELNRIKEIERWLQEYDIDKILDQLIIFRQKVKV